MEQDEKGEINKLMSTIPYIHFISHVTKFAKIGKCVTLSFLAT